MSHARFSLEGMTCASCVARVERVLTAQKGVTAASANLGMERAEVDYAAPATPESMALALVRAGYPVRQSHVTLAVDGMTCAACTGRVERVLKAQPGVAGAVANLATRRAEVTLWEPVSAETLAAVVTRAGYHAEPLEQSAPHDPAAEEAALWRQTLIAGLLTAPVFAVEMGAQLVPSFHHWLMITLPMQQLWIAQFLLTTLVLVWPGRRFFLKGLPALAKAAPDMN